MEIKQRTKKELTPKERELVQKIAGGFNDIEIREQLNIKPLTLRKMIHQILAKTGTFTRPHLIYWACKKGLL